MPFDEEDLDPHGECAAEIKRLRAALLEAARLLTLEQLQGLSENSARVLADMGLLAD